MHRYVVLKIPTGSLILAATAQGVAHVTLTGRRKAQARRFAEKLHPEGREDPDLLPDVQQQIRGFFEGKPVRFQATLDLVGLTPFQQRVLHACTEIPYGQTRTYGQLAQCIGHSCAARAVGVAMARNPIPIIIPCHRVVAADGRLGGYSAEQGIALKRWLLELESTGRPPAYRP